jgi:diguanylate cyclase (GGDEF)-like protein
MASGTLPDDAMLVDGAPRALDVILVEDDEKTRTTLCTAIRSMGHRYRLASSNWEALRLQQARRADVIVSDWRAAGMDGEEFCGRVRALDRDSYTYLLFTQAQSAKGDVVEAARAGADACLIKPMDVDELEARLIAARRIVGTYRTLSEQNVGLRRDSEAFFRSARIDALTGMGNRLRLEEDLDSLQAEVLRYQRHVCVAMCDLDEFKRYNDHHGHVAGDEALRRIAQAISQSLREADRVYRYGGEEFLVLLAEQTPESAFAALERVRRAVEGLGLPQAPGAKSPVVTVSIGLAAIAPDRGGWTRPANAESHSSARDWTRPANEESTARSAAPDSDLSVRAAIVRADRALYQAKANGRNRIAIEPLGSGVYSRYAPARVRAAARRHRA